MCRQFYDEMICDPPQQFDAKGESTLTTRLHDTLARHACTTRLHDTLSVP